MLSADCVAFLKDLKHNNNREWFSAHKADYERHWKQPGEAFAQAFAQALAARLDAPFASKLFRIHRDVRFSKNKEPYKPHMHLLARQEDEGEDDPAFYVGLEPERLFLGMGVFGFGKERLERWRKAASGAAGATLLEELNRLEDAGARLNDPALKRIPSPYPPDHPNGALLKRKGLAIWIDGRSQQLAFGPDGPSACASAVEQLFPAYSLLREILCET